MVSTPEETLKSMHDDEIARALKIVVKPLILELAYRGVYVTITSSLGDLKSDGPPTVQIAFDRSRSG